MATDPQFLMVLAFVTAAAALTAIVFRRIQLPVLFGFLTAGVLIGPHSPFFHIIPEGAGLETLADLAVVLMLFGLGLTFNLRHLRRIGGAALVVTITQGLFMLWIGRELGGLLGFGDLDSIFLGAMLSISSTLITVKVLVELDRVEHDSSRIIFGVLVLQDVAAILVLVILSGYARAANLSWVGVGRVLGEVALFFLLTLFVGLLVVPRLVDYVAHQGSDELLVLTTLGLGLSFAVLSHLAGFHVGLGAFLMGALVAEAKEHERVNEKLRPISDLFVAIFFVSMGTLVDPVQFLALWKPILLIFLLVVVGKFVTGALSTALVGYGPTTALAVGFGLAQVGEFSFVIAALGRSLGVTSDLLFPIIVGVSALTSLSAPLTIHHQDRINGALGRVMPAALLTYARLYSGWMGTLRTRDGGTRLAVRTRARRSMTLAATLLVTALGAFWFLRDPGQDFLRARDIREPAILLVYWGIALAALIPLGVRFFQTVNRWIAAWEPVPPEARRGALALRHVSQFTFYLLGIILLGLPVVAVTAPIAKTPIIALVWAGLVGSAAVILWASIARLHHRIESHVQALLDDEHVHAYAPQVVRDLVSGDFPWDLRVETLHLPRTAWAAGRRLGEIDLRSSTGASLILIERNDAREEAPGPHSVLLPGDALTLIGSPQQITSARAVLTRRVPTGPRRERMRLGRLYVAEGSELDGVRLADAALPSRTGLQVVAILRAGQSLPNPGADERLRPGDVVLVLGQQDQITAASALVRAEAKPVKEAPGSAAKA